MTNLSMFSISIWAKEHRLLAIIILFVCKFLGALTALWAGLWLAQEGLVLPDAIKWPLIAIALVLFAWYPARHLKKVYGSRSFHQIQKKFDAGLIATGFALFFFLGNQWSPDREALVTSYTAIPLATASIPSSQAEPFHDKHQMGKSLRLFKHRIQAKIFRKMLPFTLKSKGLTIALKILATIFMLGGLVLFGYIAAGVACGLSCSGNDVGAVVVIFLGLVVILAVLYFGIKGIWGKRHKT